MFIVISEAMPTVELAGMLPWLDEQWAGGRAGRRASMRAGRQASMRAGDRQAGRQNKVIAMQESRMEQV